MIAGRIKKIWIGYTLTKLELFDTTRIQKVNRTGLKGLIKFITDTDTCDSRLDSN